MFSSLMQSKSYANFPKIQSLMASKSLAHFTHHLDPPFSLIESSKSMDQLKQIHGQAITSGLTETPIFLNKVISFCCMNKFGDMDHALKLFDQIPEPKTVFLWNTMIKGYSRINSPKHGISMYLNMLRQNVKPDNYTFPFLFKGFDRNVGFSCGKELHCHVVKFGFGSNVFVQNALIHMYSLCGQMEMARRVFDISCKTDVITWNVIITGYNKTKQYNETSKLFDEMVKNGVVPSSVTLVSLLSACSKLRDLKVGKLVHEYIGKCEIKPNLILENALMDMYSACGEMDVAIGIFDRMKTRDVISWTTIVSGFINKGEIDLARTYFDQMPEKDYVSWTAMIDGYIRVNCFKEALILFREMQASNIQPDEYTMVSILTACAHLGALQLGEWIKAYIDRNKVKNDVFVGNALIDMYFKCGSVAKAKRAFFEMPRRDKFTWTAMIVGLAINGHGEEALSMFLEMLRASIKPDEITYIGVLCACSHAGLVNKGRKFFATMTAEHGVEPNVAHYGCMVDLLGRAGHLQEACEVIKNMPMKPNTIIWGALLGACRVHKDVGIAKMAAKNILELDPKNGAVYVLLCNIYAYCKKWDSLHELRESMMHRGIRKTPGCSLIEMNGVVHEFVARPVTSSIERNKLEVR